MKLWSGRALVGAIVLGLMLPADAVSAAPTNPAPANNWPMAGYNAARSNLNPVENTLTAASLPSVEHKRTIALPAESEECGVVETAPVVNGNTLYTTFGTDLAAFDLTTGVELWRSEIDPWNTTVYKSLVVSGGRVYVAGLDCISQSDPSGAYWTFDAATGASIPHPSDTFGRAINSLVVSGSRMILAGRNGTDGTAYFAVYKTTGLTRVFGNDSCYPDPLLVVGGALIATCPTEGTPKSMKAYSLVDGHVLWSKAGNWRPKRGDTDAAGATGLYAINPTGRLTALAPATGAVKWMSATEHGPVLAVGKKRLYVICDLNALCALNLTNGARLWKRSNGAGLAPTSVVIAADVVYPAPSTWPRLASTGANINVLGIPYWGRRPGDQIIIASGRLVVANLGLRTIDIYGL